MNIELEWIFFFQTKLKYELQIKNNLSTPPTGCSNQPCSSTVSWRLSLYKSSSSEYFFAAATWVVQFTKSPWNNLALRFFGSDRTAFSSYCESLSAASHTLTLLFCFVFLTCKIHCVKRKDEKLAELGIRSQTNALNKQIVDSSKSLEQSMGPKSSYAHIKPELSNSITGCRSIIFSFLFLFSNPDHTHEPKSFAWILQLFFLFSFFFFLFQVQYTRERKRFFVKERKTEKKFHCIVNENLGYECVWWRKEKLEKMSQSSLEFYGRLRNSVSIPVLFAIVWIKHSLLCRSRAQTGSINSLGISEIIKWKQQKTEMRTKTMKLFTTFFCSFSRCPSNPIFRDEQIVCFVDLIERAWFLGVDFTFWKA